MPGVTLSLSTVPTVSTIAWSFEPRTPLCRFTPARAPPFPVERMVRQWTLAVQRLASRRCTNQEPQVQHKRLEAAPCGPTARLLAYCHPTAGSWSAATARTHRRAQCSVRRCVRRAAQTAVRGGLGRGTAVRRNTRPSSSLRSLTSLGEARRMRLIRLFYASTRSCGRS